MLKKFRIFLFLFLLFIGVSSVFSAECFFSVNNDNCQRFSSSFVNFNLDFSPSDLYSNYSAVIYNKNNPENKLQVNISDNIIRNINPFLNSGVYVLDILAHTKSGILKEVKKEFIIDKTQPLPPVISMNLISSKVLGTTNFNGVNVYADLINWDGTHFVSNIISNGNFQMNLNLNQGINLVEFYDSNSNGINSAKIDRIIYNGGKPNENINLNVSSITINNNLDKLNYNTYKDTNGKYITSKRNFLITGIVGDISDGAIVYINGIKSVIKSNRFAGIVLLNEGDNKIIIENVNGNIKSEVDIKYINPKFQFLTLDIKKIIQINSDKINGTTNLDLPFNLYVNGEFRTKIIPVNGKFDYNIQNLNSKRNFIYLEGYNDQKIEKIVYYDKEKPKIEILTNNNVSNGMNFVFKITDDIGVNLNSVILTIGNKQYSGDDFTIDSDYFKVKLENFTNNDYHYSIAYSDRSGRKGDLVTGNLNINSNNTLIKRFDIGSDGYRLGNDLFLNSNNNQIILKPSKFIAFNSIYLDGVRQINYDIKSNGDVYLNLNLTKKKGNLNFEFINFNHQKFTEHFNYFTDLEKPIVKLDYIENSNFNNLKNVKVTGEILDPNFDWSSLKFNSNSNFIRFGNYFEANVVAVHNGISDLIISGNDFSLNTIETKDGVFHSVLFKDNTHTKINVLGPSKFGIVGSLSDFDLSRNNNNLDFYSGLKMYNSYLNTGNFKLSLPEMEGYRISNIDGFEKSGNKFKSILPFKVDSLKPKIYFVRNENKNEIIIDGTLSNLNTINIIKSGVQVSFSECLDKVSLYSKCLVSDDFLNGDLSIDVSDKAGNNFHTILNQNNLVDISTVIKSNSDLPKFYFNGNNKKTYQSNYYIQGNIESHSLIKSVKVNNKNNCLYDDVSFVCNVSLVDGNNSYNVTIENNAGSVIKNISIIKLVPNFGLILNNITGNGIYKVSNKYYVTKFNFNLNGEVTNNVKVSLLVDGNNYLTIGQKNSEFNVLVNISNQIAQKENDDFYIQLKAEDEYGNSEFSNKLRLIYNRVVKTLVNVFVY